MSEIIDRKECPASDTKKYWAVMTLYERFEHVIALLLSSIIAVIVLFALLQLVREIFILMISEAFKPLDHAVFQVVFGMIMTLLIAMEFKHSILKVLERKSRIVQARGVVLIALLALTRKLIILDLSVVSPWKLAALGFVVFVLAVVYYLLKETRRPLISYGQK
jgi:uncharacterized membrane protein (DUF373 family)